MKMTKTLARARRKVRIRKKLAGTAERPRLVVFRSNRHIYAQVIDDITGQTLVSSSSLTLGKGGETYDYAVCQVCGYTHEGPMEGKCPVCGAGAAAFVMVS